MTLLLLVHGLPLGGTEIMVSHLARHFRDRGVSPIVGCLDEIGELGKALMADGIVVYAPRDSAAVEGGKLRDPEGRRPAPIFRLSTSTPRDVP